ncbi:MAG: hypothetical protein ACNA8N_07020 [Trueperaceae bacterium]
MIRTAPEPQRTIVGTFLVLAAVVAAVAPMSVALRSAAVVLFSYLAFAAGGMPFAYLAALAAPALGLLAGDVAWLIMLPIVLSGNLLAMLGLEYAWRWAALVVSPLLLVVPAIFVQTMAQRDLFRVELPWDDGRGAWVGLHLLVAVFGVLIALVVDRQRGRGEARAEPRADRGDARRAPAAPAPDRGRTTGVRPPTDPAASGRARAR